MIKNIFIFLCGLAVGLFMHQSVFAAEIETSSFEDVCDSSQLFNGNTDLITGDFEGTITTTCCRRSFQFTPDLKDDVMSFFVASDGITYNENFTIFATTTHYTVIGYYMNFPNADVGNEFLCGDSEYILSNDEIGWIGLGSTNLTILKTDRYHCSEDLRVYISGDSGFYARVYYVPYDTRLRSTDLGSSSSTPLHVQSDITYRDWLIVVQWLIFILSFILCGFVFSAFARKPKRF